MDRQAEKVYVAVGNDIQDGFKTLEWTLKNWNSQPISIVILHVAHDISKDFVYTPFGKLPASSVSDEKLEVLMKYEQEKIDKLLHKYLAFCGQVKAQILTVEKCEQPIHKIIMDLIFRHQITRLVMGFTFLKTSSTWRIKSAVSGAFYIHHHKPDFCELFVICGGRLVFLRGENNKGIMEDDQGVIVAKLREKASFKGWLAKMFNDTSATSPDTTSATSSDTTSANPNSPISSQNNWECHVQEIENYFQHLLSLRLEEETCGQENVDVQKNPTESNMIAAEDMKTKLKEAQGTIKLKRKEAKANVERQTKAQWAISLCNSRAEELEAQIQEDVTNQAELKKALDSEKEQLHEVIMDTGESRSRLNSLMELQFELSNKLQISTLAKSNTESHLEKAVSSRAEMVRDIEELRQHRDVLHRRIEFCKEKDVIGMVGRLTDTSCGFKKYTAEEIRLATNNFSERLRIKSGGDWNTTMYRGRINHATVAIKILNFAKGDSKQDFKAKVTILSHIRHPHLVTMIGFCTELRCIVFEYMHNGSLRDILLRDLLFSSHISSKKRKRTLGWHDRIRIAMEICSGLGFLHTAKPRPIVHGRLSLSNILLDRNLTTKISGFGLSRTHNEQSIRSDIRAFGVLMMHLLTGRNWAGLGQAMNMDRAAVIRDLDEMAGHWPLDLAEKLAGLALTCLTSNRGPSRDLRLATVMEELNELKRYGDDIVARRRSEGLMDGDVEEIGTSDVPSCFLCPISQEVMKNPHVAADGFSYELETIEEWLGMGHETSPMTNLRLKHTFLTPNHTLRSLIQDWHNKRSLPLP
ncbi:putative transferase, protein kinase RLK-Pelle-RLCK-IXb family [Rosa chinensis]|uniref:RING-type E3 ubiquitin transferase n=1 Tax=Rosa chinensis TaxID=74649 RepID=A0A2P6RPX7_ROSCH|nr:putative U-box domain-containing protein 50 [Rosa chinensis]PRQ48467.1 putative transferase, protein kinase RLK-Pelle-RLCK-IXb family [Rosa chinensis]